MSLPFFLFQVMTSGCCLTDIDDVIHFVALGRILTSRESGRIIGRILKFLFRF